MRRRHIPDSASHDQYDCSNRNEHKTFISFYNNCQPTNDTTNSDQFEKPESHFQGCIQLTVFLPATLGILPCIFGIGANASSRWNKIANCQTDQSQHDSDYDKCRTVCFHIIIDKLNHRIGSAIDIIPVFHIRKHRMDICFSIAYRHDSTQRITFLQSIIDIAGISFIIAFSIWIICCQFRQSINTVIAYFNAISKICRQILCFYLIGKVLAFHPVGVPVNFVPESIFFWISFSLCIKIIERTFDASLRILHQRSHRRYVCHDHFLRRALAHIRIQILPGNHGIIPHLFRFLFCRSTICYHASYSCHNKKDS